MSYYFSSSSWFLFSDSTPKAENGGIENKMTLEHEYLTCLEITTKLESVVHGIEDPTKTV